MAKHGCNRDSHARCSQQTVSHALTQEIKRVTGKRQRKAAADSLCFVHSIPMCNSPLMVARAQLMRARRRSEEDRRRLSNVYGTSAQTTQTNFGLSKVWHTWTAAEWRDNQTGSNAINICVERGVGHFDQIPPNQRSRCLQFNRLILLLWFEGRNHSPFATRRKA
ncbi:hypothetical protein G5I_13813 [Acromyrmex echinatior]|uniref:Uncharacterized protein n=1 Tax=Acromyrmex echinatior TaxID=103372 RepID=F4X617_ACREC|nr:hypothetical protein G5I_13813 [Acromyrmex echinatior]